MRKKTPPVPKRLKRSDMVTDFQKNAAKRAKLNEILDDPVFREAVQILKTEIEPRGDLPLFMGNDTLSANRYHQFAGFNYLTDGLERLSLEHQAPKVIPGKRLSTELPKE